MVRSAAAYIPRARGRGYPCQVCQLPHGRRLPEQHRYGDGAASADAVGDKICRRDASRAVRVSVAFAYINETWFQESEVDYRDRGDEYLFARLLGEKGLQLVRWDLVETSAAPAFPDLKRWHSIHPA